MVRLSPRSLDPPKQPYL